MGLEGLVLKNVLGAYEPGKRHWLKVKKDYLFDGRMADSADLVVLGAWFGSGKAGGRLSIYLMGAWDAAKRRWATVTKVHTGLDEAEARRVHVSIIAHIYCWSDKIVWRFAVGEARLPTARSWPARVHRKFRTRSIAACACVCGCA